MERERERGRRGEKSETSWRKGDLTKQETVQALEVTFTAVGCTEPTRFVKGGSAHLLRTPHHLQR